MSEKLAYHYAHFPRGCNKSCCCDIIIPLHKSEKVSTWLTEAATATAVEAVVATAAVVVVVVVVVSSSSAASSLLLLSPSFSSDVGVFSESSPAAAPSASA